MDPPEKRSKVDTAHPVHGFLSNFKIHVVQAGIGKARTDIFRKQAKRFGADVISEFQKDDVTHVIVDEKMELDRLFRILKVEASDIQNIIVLKSLWLSSCIKSNCLESFDPHKLDIEEYVRLQDMSTEVPGPSGTATFEKKHSDGDLIVKDNKPNIRKVGMMFGSYKKKIAAPTAGDDPESDYEASDEEPQIEIASPSSQLPKGNWVCARSSDSAVTNHNKHITEKLEALAKTYESTNDKWRALGYQKAITALKKWPKPISSFEEAKSLPGVGNRLAEKIWEIIESGGLRKLEELSSSEEIQTINLFTNIWGAGPTTARAWVAQGFRTLDDLRSKANLTKHQKIGLERYDDFMDRMPREEAGEIEAVVKKAAESLVTGVIAMACGSYRRGKKTCGDVDVLITHPDGKSHKGIFSKLLQHLRKMGFLTDDLVTQEDNGNQKKYLGVCRLPGEQRKHRRLDIIVVPYDEFACAIMYFTGSAHFNRSMRNLASKMGMSLSEHALSTGVVRSQGEKLNKGTPLPTPTEESVFTHLGLKYRPPEERDH